MPRMIGAGLSRREREIVDVLNRLGEATAAEVEAAMPDAPSNAAVRSILRIMEAKGYVRHEEKSRRYVYSAAEPKAAAARSALTGVLDTFFGGSLSTAVKSLLSEADTELSEVELTELSQMIDRAQHRSAK